MGISKAKKAVTALRERVNTCYENSDLLKRALNKEDYEATMKCAEEIKDILEAYDRQLEITRNTAKNAKRKINNKKRELQKNPLNFLADCLQELENGGKYIVTCENKVFYDLAYKMRKASVTQKGRVKISNNYKRG